MATDPVCGMTIDPTTARKTSDYRGTTFYFCSPGCKKAFDADPAAYASAGDARARTRARTGRRRYGRPAAGAPAASRRPDRRRGHGADPLRTPDA